VSRTAKPLAIAALLLAGGAAAAYGIGRTSAAEAQPATPTAPEAEAALKAACQPEAAQAVAASLAGAKVTVRPIEEFPKFQGGVRFVAAHGGVPAYCQIQGSFVTNPATGKTANFLATLPANWNGKYLQLGCSGHCGNFAVSDPAMPFITITNQGYPNQIIIKGYAAFATDEGHVGMEGGTWAQKGPGQVDRDAITDYYYRADKVLAQVGKAFTTAFYGHLKGAPQKIAYSYFSGCSGGGRDAFVAASYFPEEFDGIIGGSAYNLAGRAYHAVGTALATLRTPDSGIPASLLPLVEKTVMAQCDALDGVKDGLIQNPAACKFSPERDLPHCTGDKPGDQCFTKAQRETLSTVFSAATDEHGRVVQPGYSVSELQGDFAPPTPATDPSGAEPWPDKNPQGGLYALGNAALKVFAHNNDPDFSSRSIVSYRAGGPGQVTGYHMVIPQAEVAAVRAATRPGVGHYPENADKLIKLNRKFLIWHNFSDEKLTPYMSVNYYKQLAKLQGGYAKLQDNVRLFMIPGSGHCSMSGVGPNNFDALTAIENWVEKGKAPEALPARLYPEMKVTVVTLPDMSKPPIHSMPLCKFPEMARYSGKGDVKDAANWTCPAGDTRMLTVGESGRQAGVID
jgi:feruloyl esterase